MGWTQGRAYHQDLRERVFQVADAGTSVTGVAKILRVSVSYVSKVLGRRRRTGETTARPQRGHVPAKLAAYHAAIRDRVSAVPDATLRELQVWLKETHQVVASTTLIWEVLRELKLTLKKDRACRGTDPAGCCSGTVHMARRATDAEPDEIGIPRRDRDQDEYDTSLRPLGARHPADRPYPAWPLEDLEFHRRPSGQRHGGSLRVRRRDHGGDVPQLY